MDIQPWVENPRLEDPATSPSARPPNTRLLLSCIAAAECSPRWSETEPGVNAHSKSKPALAGDSGLQMSSPNSEFVVISLDGSQIL